MLRALVLLAALWSGPALALSCDRFEPVDAFKFASDAPEPYVVIHGALSFDASKAPTAFFPNAVPVTLPGRVSGRLLGPNGFEEPATLNIRVEFVCFADYCGTVSPGNSVLMFLRETPQGYALSPTPCQRMGFSDPSHAVLEDMRQCLMGRCPK